MKVSRYYDHPVTIDGEVIRFKIKRMDVGEHVEFSARARKNAEPTYMRFISRDTTELEQERNEKGDFKLSLEQMADRKIRELEPERRAEFDAALEADEAQAQDFLKYVFERFVKCAGGLLEELEDGTEKSVTEGLDVLRVFGARNDVLGELLEAVRMENELSTEQKKTWRLLSGSTVSSSGQGPDPGGPKPATIVASAETSASIVNAVATEPEGLEAPAPEPEAELGPCGSTEISPSSDARSGA